MTDLILALLRHADSQHTEDAENLLDPPLGGRGNHIPLGKKRGKAQSKRLCATLLKKGIRPDAIYSSPALRATGTVEPLALALNLRITIEDDMQEITWGKAEGQPRSLLKNFTELRAQQGFDFRLPPFSLFCPTIYMILYLKI